MFSIRKLLVLPVSIILSLQAVQAELAQPDNVGGGTGRTLYVSVNTGSNGNDGLSEASAWGTFSHAISNAQPGDTVLLRGGDYYETNLAPWKNWQISNVGSPGQYITFRNYPGETPTMWVDTWNGIELQNAAYIVIDGLEVRGHPDPVEIIGLPENHPIRKQFADANTYGNEVWFGNGIAVAGINHHIRIRNCHIHGVGGNGIGLSGGNVFLIEGNLVWNTAHRSDAGNSGISTGSMRHYVAEPQNYGIVIRNNISHSNRNMVGFKFYLNGTQLTDGNGIIIDYQNISHTSADGDRGVYPHRTLVANNVAFNNGGRGIHAFRSSYVDFVHNTVYHNNQSPDFLSSMINDGDMNSVGENADVNFFNNISVARPGRRAFNRGGSGSMTASEVGETIGNIWVSPLNVNSWPNGSLDPRLNLATNPMLRNPHLQAQFADFRLQAVSSAIGYGTDTPASVRFTNSDNIGIQRSGLPTAGALLYDNSGVAAVTVEVNGGEGGGSWRPGSRILLRADPPAPGKMFYRWRGDISKLREVYSAQTYLLVPDRDVEITAEYKDVETVDAVGFSIPGGNYGSSVDVAFVPPMPGVEIFFSTDGSEPSPTNGTLWFNQGALTISTSMILKAVAYAIGYQPSPVSTAVYRIGADAKDFHVLEVVNGEGSGAYTQGAAVAITATSTVAGTTFSRWLGDVTAVQVPGSPSTTFTMPDRNAFIAAAFRPYGGFEAEQVDPFQATNAVGDSIELPPSSHVSASNGSYLTVNATASGTRFIFDLPEIAPGDYEFGFYYRASSNMGKVQLKWNGQNLGTVVDLYAASPGFVPSTAVNLTVEQATGNQLVMEVIDKNASSSGYGLNADLFSFFGLQEFTSYGAWTVDHLIGSVEQGQLHQHADANGNGWSNLLEYALSMEANGAGLRLVPNESGMSLQFNRLDDPFLRYVVMSGCSLDPALMDVLWSSDGSLLQTTEQRLDFPLPATSGDGSTRRFFRLLIQPSDH